MNQYYCSSTLRRGKKTGCNKTVIRLSVSHMVDICSYRILYQGLCTKKKRRKKNINKASNYRDSWASEMSQWCCGAQQTQPGVKSLCLWGRRRRKQRRMRERRRRKRRRFNQLRCPTVRSIATKLDTHTQKHTNVVHIVKWNVVQQVKCSLKSSLRREWCIMQSKF